MYIYTYIHTYIYKYTYSCMQPSCTKRLGEGMVTKSNLTQAEEYLDSTLKGKYTLNDGKKGKGKGKGLRLVKA